MLLEYAVRNSEVKEPTRGNASDAGMDLYYYSEEKEAVHIPPMGKVKLDTGLKFAIPHGFAMEIKNRSSVSSEKGLIVGACIIDPGFKGEVKIGLHNISDTIQTIKPGDKIAQFLVYPIVHVSLIEADAEEMFSRQLTMSDREEGGFGSTGDS